MVLSLTADLLEKDSTNYFGTSAREAVAAKPQVGYITVHFVFPFLKNGLSN